MDLMSISDGGIRFEYEFDDPSKQTFKFKVSGVMAAHFEKVQKTIMDLIRDIEHDTGLVQIGQSTVLAGPLKGKSVEDLDVDEGNGQGFRNLLDIFSTIYPYGESELYYGVSPYEALPHWADLVSFLLMKISMGAKGGVSLIDLYNGFETTLRPYSEVNNYSKERIANLLAEVSSTDEYNKIQDEISDIVIQSITELSNMLSKDLAVFNRDEKFYIPAECLELLGKQEVESMTIRQLYEKYDVGTVATLLIRTNPKSRNPNAEVYEKLKDHLIVYLHYIYNLLPYCAFLPEMKMFWKDELTTENLVSFLEMRPEDQATDYIRRIDNLMERMEKR